MVLTHIAWATIVTSAQGLSQGLHLGRGIVGPRFFCENLREGSVGTTPYQMRYILCVMLYLVSLTAMSTVIYPGETVDITHQATTGDHAPSWSTDNPTLSLSSVGFLCHVSPQAYFGGTATVTCTYECSIGSTSYTRSKKWTFTCGDTNLSISPTSKSIKIGESFQITCGYNRPTYITPSIQYTGYDSSILSVSRDGTVTGIKAGSTQIYVKSNIGTNSVICSVNVSNSGTGNLSSSNSAYDSWDTSGSTTITIETPGSLSELIGSEKYSIGNLRIVGCLNGSDLKLLRDMASQGRLVVIDLKDAVFVSGGSWYVQAWGKYYYTEDNEAMPYCAFAWLDKLKRIRFPEYCPWLTNRSILQCKSLEEIAIPAGVQFFDAMSLDGGYGDMPMTTLHLPSSFNNLYTTIYKCKNLTNIYCHAIKPPLVASESSFNTATNCKNGILYVPKGSAQAYWRAEGWRLFNDIKETLDVCNTLYFRIGSNGCIKYKDNMIRQRYAVEYSGWKAFEVPDYETVNFEIIPDEGYNVSSITINGSEVDSNKNRISIGLLEKHTTITVSFDKANAILPVENEKHMPSMVYNLSGAHICTIQSIEELDNLTSGFYIVKQGNTTKKILIK